MDLELPQLILQAVEQDKKNLLILLGATILIFILQFAFTAFKETKVLESFFPYLRSQLMTRPAYADYFANCWTYIIIFGTLTYILPKFREYLFCVTFLWFGYWIEFCLVYNQPLAWLYFIPIGYSTFAGISLIAIFTYRFYTK